MATGDTAEFYRAIGLDPSKMKGRYRVLEDILESDEEDDEE